MWVISLTFFFKKNYFGLLQVFPEIKKKMREITSLCMSIFMFIKFIKYIAYFLGWNYLNYVKQE